MSNVFCDRLGPWCPTEGCCETLFSNAGHLNDPRRMMMRIRMYERLVIGKHRMERIYLSTEEILRRYMKRFRDNSWDEEEERDARDYLEQEKNIWKEAYPILGGGRVE